MLCKISVVKPTSLTIFGSKLIMWSTFFTYLHVYQKDFSKFSLHGYVYSCKSFYQLLNFAVDRASSYIISVQKHHLQELTKYLQAPLQTHFAISEIQKFCDFWMLLYLDFSIFPNSWIRWKRSFFEFVRSRLHFQFFPNSLKSLEIWILRFHWFRILSDCEDSFSGTVCL